MFKLLSVLQSRAANDPSRPALLFTKRGSFVQYGFEDLHIEARRWARRFLAAGLQQQSIVAIVLDHRVEMYGAYLGAMRAGLIPTLFSYRTPKQDAATYWTAQRALFARVAPACIVTYGEQLERLPELTSGFACHAIDVNSAWPEERVQLPALALVEADDRIALLQHSSGTTGAKKGVALTFDAIARQARALEAALPVSRDDRIVSWLPLYHDMGLLTAFLLPIHWGSSVIAFDAFEWLARPSLFFELVERFRATQAWLPNFALNHLARTCESAAPSDLSSLRAVVSSSEPCKPATFERFREVFQPWGLGRAVLRTSYGMAESVFAATLSLPDAEPASCDERGIAYLSCGRPLEGLELRVRSAADERTGEIEVRGSYVVAEYFRNPEWTAASFADGWFSTGDIGFFESGELYVCGRTKETIVVHGRNFYAQDIEEIANGVEGVKPGRSVAIGLYDPGTASEELSIVCESEWDDAAALSALVRSLKSTIYGALGVQVKSVRVFPIGTLTKTTSGKISRDVNAALLDRDAMEVRA